MSDPRPTVARLSDDGARGPVWICEECGMVLAFLSVMISHLYIEHRVSSLGQDGSVLRGNLSPEP